MHKPSEYCRRGNAILTDLEGPVGVALDEMRELYSRKHTATNTFDVLVVKWMEYVRSLPEDDQIAVMLAAAKLAPAMIGHKDVRTWCERFAAKISVIYKAA